MAEETTTIKDNSQTTTVPVSDGKTTVEEKKIEAKKEDKDITWEDKVKDKNSEELVKMYGEAQKKLGEMSSQVAQNDDLIKQMNVILAAIGENPEREEMVKTWIQKQVEKAGGKTTVEDKKPEDATITDLRRSQETEIIKSFEKKYGIDQLAEDKKKEMNGKIANTLWSVADPLGKYEKWEDLVKAIPLTKLESLLERSYKEINWANLEEKMASSGDLTMGKIPSLGLPSEPEVKLTQEEETVAKKLGITPEKYLERKKQKLANK